MPHRDPETGQFVGDHGGAPGTDYTDFEYEHTHIETQFADPTGAGVADLTFSIDPLEDRGGLESDEVAELVGLWYQAQLYSATNLDLTDPATQSNSFRARVGFGANIEIGEEFPPSIDTADVVGVLGANTSSYDDADADSSFDLIATTEPGLFWMDFMAAQAYEFDDAGGYAIPGSEMRAAGSRFYRQKLGRGPIIDPTDTLNFLIEMDNSGNQDWNPRVEILQTTIWDVAAQEGRRQQFSVP